MNVMQELTTMQQVLDSMETSVKLLRQTRDERRTEEADQQKRP